MSFVYFAEHPKRGIKIGCSGNPIARARSLSASLLICIRGDRATERTMHRRFAELRIDGEWFRDCPRLRNYAMQLRSCRIPIPDKQIVIYPDDDLRKKIDAEGLRRRRKLGPTVLEIVLEYFAKKKG